MKVTVRKNDDEVRRILFETEPQKASQHSGYGLQVPATTEQAQWNEISEIRLYSKVLKFKPAGVNRNFMLGQLVICMNNIFEDETDTDFELFLSNADFRKYQSRKDIPGKTDILVFKPSYKIRPNAEMIKAKLQQLYDMETVEKNEYLPDHFAEVCEFELPPMDSDDMPSDLEELKKEPEFPPPPTVDKTPLAVKRKAPSHRSPGSTRSNTPAGKEK